MKHIKLFEQFVNEAEWVKVWAINDYAPLDSGLWKAAGNGRNLSRHKPQEVNDIFQDGTIISNKSEYSTELLTDAAYALASEGVNVKEKPIQNGVLVVKFSNIEYSYEFKGGKWTASAGPFEGPMDIYEFITALVARKYKNFKDKSVGSK